MSVFDGKAKIGRSVPDPNTDKDLPGSGSLGFSNITSPGGLAGCTGIDAALVAGDQWHILQGNRQVMINGDWTQTTLGTKTCTVMQNRITTTTANRNDTIVGSTVRTNVGAAAHNYISNHVVTHASPGMRFEPGTWLHYAADWTVAHSNYKNFGVFYFQFYGIYVSITPVLLELRGAYAGYTTGYFHWETFDNQAKLMENKLGALQMKINGLENDLEGVCLGVLCRFEIIEMAINSICL